MRKRSILILFVLILSLVLLLQVSSSAGEPCDKLGCTPGYWKQPQHLDSWVFYSPDAYFDDTFGVGPRITLLDALWLKGGGENAFLRHATAGLLNSVHPDVHYYYYHDALLAFVQNTYAGTPPDFEYNKDLLAGWNEAGCPLD